MLQQYHRFPVAPKMKLLGETVAEKSGERYLKGRRPGKKKS